jgi:hypothetical protein
MTKDELIESLRQLGRGRLDAADALAEHFMPESKVIEVPVPPVAPSVDVYESKWSQPIPSESSNGFESKAD